MISNWPEIKRVADDAEHVTKFVFSKPDAVAEAVLYRYPTYADRTVICCSSQSGCPVGCRFCGAGDHFVRSLSGDEIADQAKHCLDIVAAETGTLPAHMGRLQIMFMSMGEPLLNMKGMIPAIKRLSIEYPKAALLISTSAPDVDYDEVTNLSIAVPTIGLQFSLHESTDEARDALIPFRKKLNLAQIAAAGERWAARTRRKPYFNYCAHDSNSSEADADRLLALFDPRVWCATVSVICERDEDLPARNQHQRDLAVDFGNRLLARSYDVRVFDPAGQDTVGGGCGQLWFVQDWMRQHPSLARQSIGHGRTAVHAPALA